VGEKREEGTCWEMNEKEGFSLEQRHYSNIIGLVWNVVVVAAWK
jgi:hypothetical protein